MTDVEFLEFLETLDIKAQAGLCQFKFDGARCFLQDIRDLIKEKQEELSFIQPS